MKEILKTKNWFLISTIFIVLAFTYSCKKLSKYKRTIVIGKVTNMAIEKGIPNARVYLKAYNNSGRTLPTKAQIMMETRTDSEGNYRFEFDAYDPFINNTKSKADYGVTYDKEGKIGTIYTGYDTLLYFEDIFGIEIKPFKHIDEIGGTFIANINVVLAGRFFFQFYNEKPIQNETDIVNVRCQDKFLEFRVTSTGGIDQTQNNSFLMNLPTILITGKNTLKYSILKNGITTNLDTTFEVEAKDYYINFRY